MNAPTPNTIDAQVVEGAHTPGPWRAEHLAANAGSNERPWVGRLDEHRYAALSCGETQSEAIANARLIAAAPELLAAAKALDAFWLQDFEPPHDDPEQQEPRLLTEETLHIWRTIRAAIAKTSPARTLSTNTEGERA